jgi:hypothetical protein
VPGEHSSNDLIFSVKIQTKSVVEILILAIPFTSPHFQFRLFRNQSGRARAGSSATNKRPPEGGPIGIDTAGKSSIARQLAAAPMRFLAVGVEHAHGVAIDRLGRDHLDRGCFDRREAFFKRGDCVPKIVPTRCQCSGEDWIGRVGAVRYPGTPLFGGNVGVDETDGEIEIIHH